MRPIAELTAAAREIERTRDPAAESRSRRPTTRSPSWRARSRTCSRRSTPRAPRPRRRCARQREFVADASHELRTPLTSVLANLELLVDAARAASDGRGRRGRRCARRSGCAGSSPTCCCSPAPTPAARRPARPVDLGAGASSRRRPSSSRSPTGTRSDDRRARPRDRRRRARRPAPPRAQPDRERRCATRRPARPSTRAVRAPRRRGRARGRGRRARHPAGAATALFERFVRGGGDRGAAASRPRPRDRPGGGRVPRRHASPRGPARTAARASSCDLPAACRRARARAGPRAVGLA